LAAALIAVAVVLATSVTWLMMRGRARLSETRALAEANLERARLEQRLESEREATKEKLQLLEKAEERLSDAFKALSSTALSDNSTEFLKLAGTRFETLKQGAETDLAKRETAISNLLSPMSDTLKKVGDELNRLELARGTAYSTLTTQVTEMAKTETDLKKETSALVKALRKPTVRGNWGEMQLKRAVEFAGMLGHCDFKEQESIPTEEGATLRPDMVVKLAGGKNVVVDSKAPLEHYLNALEAQNEAERERELKEYVNGVLTHISQLSDKEYWSHLESTPEFVVMFLPGEAFFSAALDADPALLEKGFEKRVILASPTTLIALLKAVAYGWQQEVIVESFRKIGTLGKGLYDAVSTFSDHMAATGKSLQAAVKHHNDAVGSLERNVLVQARKFRDQGVISQAYKDIEELQGIETPVRELQAPEALASGPDAPDGDSTE
jgi:DNA recombination protein RmuC